MMTLKQFIAEVFDSPWTLKRELYTDFWYGIQHQLKHFYKTSIFSLFRVQETNDYILEFVYKNYYEIHHIDSKLRSGELKMDSENPNPRFYSTLIERIKHHVGKAHGVRVVTTQKLITKYHSLAKKLATKNQYNISEIEPYVTPTGEKYECFYITLRMPISEMLKELKNEFK